MIVLTRSFSVAAKSCQDGARATFLQYNYILGCDIEHHTRMMASSYLTRECQESLIIESVAENQRLNEDDGSGHGNDYGNVAEQANTM